MNGDLNTAVGVNALYTAQGSGNIAIGPNAGGGISVASGVIAIGSAGAD